MNQHLLYAQMPEYKRRVKHARSVISRGLELCRYPYVACSFGKDSAAMLHMILEQKTDVDVRFIRWQETEMLDSFERVICEWQNRYQINLSILDLTRSSLDESVPDRWKRLESLLPADGYFIGLRADEKNGRKMTLKMHGEIYRMKSGLVRISPLAWWTTRDVGAYTVVHDLPMLDAYRAEGFDTRTTARVPRADYGIREGALARLKHRDIARWNQLVQAMPEVNDYA